MARQMFQRPKCDAQFFKDPRSIPYGIRMLVPEQPEADKAQFWFIPKTLPINQLAEGACVGFGWAGELAVHPIEIPVWNGFAKGLYQGAVNIDKAEGRFFEDGATIIAGAKAAKKAGHISGYHACFGMKEFTDALRVKGPVVLGIPWYDGMYQTEESGLIRVSGALAGGHCLLATGYIPKSIMYKRAVTRADQMAQALVKAFGTSLYQVLNSWGPDFGLNGVGYVREPDMERLLIQEKGEAYIATDIRPAPKPPHWWQRIAREMRLS